MDFQNLLNLFLKKFRSHAADTLGVDMEIQSQKIQELESFRCQLDTFAMLDFRGSAIGFLSCACNEVSLAQLIDAELPKEIEARNEMRKEYGGALTELLNSVSGELVEEFRQEIPIITILAPKLYFNSDFIYPEVPCYTIYIETNFGPFELTICIDEMQQDILKLLDEAKSSNTAKSNFLATMSHEIRTPINGIMGMTELLLSTQLDEEQSEYGTLIQHSTEALLTIINDILDFSKIEAGKIIIENIRFDLYSTLESCIDVMASVIYKKGLEVSLLIDADVPRLIKGDPSRIRQIILNLLSNAVKFTKEGEITLRVLREDCIDHDLVLKYEIEDSGCGIAKDAMTKLFQAFTQADTTTTRKYSGTGLGLAISKKMAQAMGGEIGVDSEIDIGSIFWFTTKNQVCHEVENLNLSHNYKEGTRIFLIDPFEMNIKVFNHYFEDLDVTLDHYHELEEALPSLETQQPEVIIVYFEGDKNVDTVTTTYRHLYEKYPDIRLIFLTDYGHKGDAQKIKESGFDAYFVKPIKFEYLKYCLQYFASSDAQGNKEKPKFITQHLIKEQLRPELEILIVEDNKINQKIVAKMMKKFELSYSLAENGEKALEAAKARNFHLIFMDLQMPVMNGFDSTLAIRKHEKVSGHKSFIIALTANALDEDRKKCREVGMDDFIAKPMRSEELMGMIRKYGR